jgi:hypothetical protein
MAGPGDEIAAAASQGDGRLRASHADREQVIEALKVAFVGERLAKDEFDLRVGQAFAARTHAELAAVTVGLPAEPATAREPATAELATADELATAEPATADELVAAEPAMAACAYSEPPAVRPGRLLAVATAVCAGVWMLGLLLPWPENSEGDPPKGVVLLVFLTTLVYLFVLAMTLWVGAAALVESWLKRRRSGGGRAGSVS